MITLQLFFMILVVGILLYLIVDGLWTGSVWVKGNRSGIVNYRQWAHKCDRVDEPVSYWFAMGFCGVAMLVIFWVLVSA